MTTVVIATSDWARRPEFGGLMWVPLQYLLGLRDLGIQAYWIDHLRRVDPFRKDHTVEYLWSRFERLARGCGMEGACGIVYDDGAAHLGCSPAGLDRLRGEADLLVALGRTPPDSSPLLQIVRRAYVDIDPGFTQIWATQRDLGLDRYHHFFTVGQNVGGRDFPIPLGEIDWKPVLTPVHLPSWPAAIDDTCVRISTVADWRGSQEAVYDGQYFGTKRSEFIRFLHMPLKTERPFELALCIGQQDFEDLGLLTGHNWRILDPYRYAGDADSFREFVQDSWAEFAVAKHGFVKSNSGWFSDRTACYLASGKPALVQSTGFEGVLPTGEGLVTFSDVEEAVQAIRKVESRYLEHCRAAREFAERHLDSTKVVSSLLTEVGMAAERSGRTTTPALT